MKKFKKVLTALCVMVMVCLCALPFAACGKKKDPTPPPQDPPKYYENDPKAVIIKTYDELKAFITDFTTNQRLLSKVGEIDGGYVVIANDIDCNNESLTPILSQNGEGINFKIDGDGHTIKNFKVTETKPAQLSGGSATAGTTCLALFPLFEGGTLENITFENVTFEKSFTAEEESNVNVGLVGYCKSSGENVGEVADNHCSTFKNVNLKNFTVNVTAESNTSPNQSYYPLAIGALIGFDSDNTQHGEFLAEDATMALRENITVTNFKVNLTKNEGATFIGGVTGQIHWERVTYKNCNVDGKFTITNTGTNKVDDSTFDKKHMGDIVCLGGIYGANIKGHFEQIIDGGKTNIEMVVTGQENLVYASNVGGLQTEKSFEEGKFHIETIKNNFVGTCTLKVGEGEKKNLTSTTNID